MVIMPKEAILSFKDPVNGKPYYFYKDNYLNHLKKHSELGQSGFMNRIKDAIINPTCIYPSYEPGKKITSYCFYKEEFTLNGVTRYTKVVVWKNKEEYIIKTAFRPDNIRESKYHKECKRP